MESRKCHQDFHLHMRWLMGLAQVVGLLIGSAGIPYSRLACEQRGADSALPLHILLACLMPSCLLLSGYCDSTVLKKSVPPLPSDTMRSWESRLDPRAGKANNKATRERQHRFVGPWLFLIRASSEKLPSNLSISYLLVSSAPSCEASPATGASKALGLRLR